MALWRLGGRRCSNVAATLLGPASSARHESILRALNFIPRACGPCHSVEGFSPVPSITGAGSSSLNPRMAARGGLAGASTASRTAGMAFARSFLEKNSPRIGTSTSARWAEANVKLRGTRETRNQFQQLRLLSTSVKGSEEKKKTSENKSLAKRISSLLSELEEVPLGALGLGLAGAIPFVGLAPGIVSLLPLTESLSSIHVEAQAAYGAVILTFLGGPHWGLAMADWGGSTTSKFSRKTLHTVRYVWSVIPSLVAWPALLLSPVPKLALLITSFGIVLGVDATFARMGLIPSWYMPLRVLLTGIAMLSMTSSLIVTVATNVSTQ